MTSAARVAAILIALAVAWCVHPCRAASAAASERAALAQAVDQLCHWSGMIRRTDLSKIERFPPSGGWRYTAEADLVVDGATKHYTLGFDARFRVMHFSPKWIAADATLGDDTLKDQRLRRMCARRAGEMKKLLGWKSVTGPYIQRIEAGFLVTFETATAEEQKKANDDGELLHPCVSFVVTPKGTVCAGFWGA